jgi:hypothetical protein
MTMPIVSGVVYGLHGVFNYKMHNASLGPRLGMLFPAARTAVMAFRGPFAGALATPGEAYIRSSTQSVVITSGATISGLNMILDGTLLCTANGNLMFFSMNELASGTTVFLEGSFLVVWTLGTLPT